VVRCCRDLLRDHASFLAFIRAIRCRVRSCGRPRPPGRPCSRRRPVLEFRSAV